MSERKILPNGVPIYSLNSHETDWLFREIFEERSYCRHGINIPENATVVDIGANIGMFSLFALSESPKARIFAFEPIPEVNDILSENLKQFKDQVQIFQFGISNKQEELSFTYYPNYSVLSGFHADLEEDVEFLTQAIRNQMVSDHPDKTEVPDEILRRMVQEKFVNPQQLTIQTDTISHFISLLKLDQIDLLKIDAEKCELQILQGVKQTHWPRIKQVVVELNSRSDLNQSITLLQRQNFFVEIEQELQFSQSETYLLFAKRKE